MITTQTAKNGFEDGAKLTGVVGMIQAIKTGGFEYSYIDAKRRQKLLFFICDDKGDADVPCPLVGATRLYYIYLGYPQNPPAQAQPRPNANANPRQVVVCARVPLSIQKRAGCT